MADNSVDAVVTSPPYYNAREYSHWDSFDSYMHDMEQIFSEVFRVLKNHHNIVVNVGDITAQTGKAKWAVKKVPIGANFIVMLEKIGFIYVDDYIWDKGEPQSKRNIGNPPFPYYQYPVNCYEHIIVCAKHQIDKTKIPCPVCNKIITQSNSCSGIGVQSWECKNPDCPTKSEHNRGKRFSCKSVMMNDYKLPENEISSDLIKRWRRDIVKIPPVVKVNCKGENIIGHSAPFPEDIPEMAIRFFSGAGDTVLDCFMGAGTTAIAALRCERNYIGFEKSKEFCQIAEKRIKTYLSAKETEISVKKEVV